ncbi:hypothetical protein D3C80_1382340 [compost metagenome]
MPVLPAALYYNIRSFTVLHGVSQQLPEHEAQPLAVCQHHFSLKLDIEPDALRDTPRSKSPDLFIQNWPKRCSLNEKIVTHERNPLLVQLLVEQMVNPQPFVHHLGLQRFIRNALDHQLHRCERCLHLVNPGQQIVLFLLQQPEVHGRFPPVSLRLEGYRILHDLLKRTVRLPECLQIIHLIPGLHRPVEPGLLLIPEEHKQRAEQHIQQHDIEHRQEWDRRIYKSHE